MKICVYAICKNESKFVDRFMDSCKDADGIYVLDTGSTDGTLDAFQTWADKHQWPCIIGDSKPRMDGEFIDCGLVVVQKQISPWRFDVARNAALDMVPKDTDICVCLDLDEVLCPGWREALEATWKPGTTRAHYRYVWNFNPDGSEGTVFLSEKIHARHGFKWVFPVHEILQYDGAEQHITVDGLCVEHHADPSKSRANYLPLLELAVKENPDNDRMMHYLGREYMFHGDYLNAIYTLQHHLEMPSSTWDAERAASMRYLSRCWQEYSPEQAELWLHRAIEEAPQYREPYTDMAELMYNRKDWRGVVRYADKALKITHRELSYITEPKAWGSFLWDILSLAWWNLGQREYALNCAKKALELEPTNERMRANVKMMEAVA